jgi:hypothetical protein
MLKKLLGLAALVGMVLAFNSADSAATAGVKVAEGDWIQLFNGQNLVGWKTHPDDKAKWEVKDRAIVGSGPVGHLYTGKGDYQNFHFKIEAKINDKGRSGQFFRAQYDSGIPRGYEGVINVGAEDPLKTGSLNPSFNPNLTGEEKGKITVKQAAHKADDWFTQEVIAEGNHITILVNGKKTAEFTDKNNTYTKGHFAIQQHDPGSVIMVRKAMMKTLPVK